MLIQEDYFKNIFNTVREAILILDENMRVLSANRSFFKIFRVDSAETVGSLLYDLGNRQWNIPYLRVLLEDVLPKNDTVDDYEIEHDFENIGPKTMLLNACKIREKNNDVPIILLAIEDITGRRTVEKELAMTEGKYQELVQNANSIILKMDRDGKVIFFNEFAKKFFGYTEEEMLGSSVVGTIVPETGSSFFDIGSMIKDIGPNPDKYITNENENMRSNGERVWVAWTNRAIHDEFGNVTEILCIGNDITERKRLESLLTDSEERYRRLFETASDGIVLLEKNEGTITHTNPAAEKMLGYSKEECLGKKMQDIGVSLDMSNFPIIMQGLNKSGIVNYTDVPVRTRSGQNIFTDIYMVDRARLAQCNIRDVTARKRAEEALKEEKAFIEKALNALLDVFFVIDLEGRFLRWNKTMEAASGYTDKEIALMKAADFFRKDYSERVSEAIQLALKEGNASVDVVVVTKNGRQIPYEFRAALMRDHAGNSIGISGVGRDLTERDNLVTQLRQAQKMEALGTLAGGIAHDFNNILNVIMGYGAMIMDKLGGDGLLKELMNEVLAAAEMAANLTKRLLVFSRKQVVEVRPVNINELILSMEKMLCRIVGEDIVITLELSDREMIVMADSGQIEQVLMNLISNAHDAMPKGGRLMISTDIKEVDDAYITAYGYGKPGMYTLISVTDTGSGMASETQEKIFEPFFTTKEIGKGTGLGLSIAYGIIRQHAGYIKVYSEEGKGTTFKILLPVITEEISGRQEVEAEVPIKGGTETILVAEDDASLRKLSSIVLESFGYDVITAEDGEEAITRYKEHREKIQLVILDMLMPKKNGKEVYEEIRRLSPAVRVLFATGYTMDMLTKKELLGQDMAFITKPITPKDLLKEVRNVLDRKEISGTWQ